MVLDPYAKAIARAVTWDDAMFGYTIGQPQADVVFDPRDSAPFAPLAAVVDSAFTWGDDRRPRTPWHQTVIYEMHVRGFSKLQTRLPERIRGTYEALTTDAAISHLLKLGVTAVELMPVHHHSYDRHLVERGLTNYWGYNTLAFFAPNIRYAADRTPTGTVREFKRMVRALHNAGLEVILDVVYNHTAEGNHLGPTLSLRGIDNRAYYRLLAENPRYYLDFTGCGNTLNMQSPQVLQLIMDSLRYWVLEMHVDGFRFDLASALARELYEVDRLGAFFDIIHQDPVLSQVKLIAEPWDLGAGGYQVGQLSRCSGPSGTASTATRCGASGAATAASCPSSPPGSPAATISTSRAAAGRTRASTSSPPTTDSRCATWSPTTRSTTRRTATATATAKSHNLSWNCGVEGETDDPAVNALRERQQRNLLATLLLSQGVPMLSGGDEIQRTQRGNNNAYCQDNEISWTSWDLTPAQRELLDFTSRLIRIRHEHPVLRRRRFFRGRAVRGADVKDIAWLDPGGSEMTDESWHAGFVRASACGSKGMPSTKSTSADSPSPATRCCCCSTPTTTRIDFTLPVEDADERWERLLDTSDAEPCHRIASKGRRLPYRRTLGGPVPARAGRAASRRPEVGRGDDQGDADRARAGAGGVGSGRGRPAHAEADGAHGAQRAGPRGGPRAGS